MDEHRLMAAALDFLSMWYWKLPRNINNHSYILTVTELWLYLKLVVPTSYLSLWSHREIFFPLFFPDAYHSWLCVPAGLSWAVWVHSCFLLFAFAAWGWLCLQCVEGISPQPVLVWGPTDTLLFADPAQLSQVECCSWLVVALKQDSWGTLEANWSLHFPRYPKEPETLSLHCLLESCG